MNRTPATTDTASPARVGTIALWALRIALAILFVVNFGPGKVMGSEQAVQTFADIGVGQWLRYLTGALEIVFGLGLLIPRLGGLAALGLVGVLAGAVLAEIVLLDADVLVPLTLLICVAAIAWFRRHDTRAVVGRLRATAPRPAR